MSCPVKSFTVLNHDSDQAKRSYCVKHFKTFTLYTFSKNRVKKSNCSDINGIVSSFESSITLFCLRNARDNRSA